MLIAVAESDALESLASGPLYRFADWPNPEVPNLRAGVYTVWDGPTFLYVGMAGRGLPSGAHLAPLESFTHRNRGLTDRLRSHASGRRSGDQFCIYVCDRLVLPTLSPDDLAEAGAGRLNLDLRTRAYIHERLTYRFVVTDSSKEAHELERMIRESGLSGENPILNPRRPQPG
jgi:hypothetical protein